MKKLHLSITEFALPSPKIGSIDTYSGFAIGSQRAILLHQEFQYQLQEKHAQYEPEVIITHVFEYKRMQLKISGRMDGLYRDNPVRIEEIKTALDSKKLMDSLADSYFTHPYWLQLQTYGYIWWLKKNRLPDLNLLVVSLRTKKTSVLNIELDVPQYENWLDKRLQEIVHDVKEITHRQNKRKKEGAGLIFPFEKPRPCQKELIETVDVRMEKHRPMLLQAPTGMGKTTGVLFPTLRESLSRGQKTIYVTPKNSQHQIAVDTVNKLQAKGANIKSLVLTSKRKLCMKKEPFCHAEYCEFAKNHYTKVTENTLLAKVKRQKNLNALFFNKMATQHQVCPYELQMESIPFADVIIGDYNYVFSPNSQSLRVTQLHFSEKEKNNLVIDEAHNLITRSLEYYSPSLYINYFTHLLADLNQFTEGFRTKVMHHLKACISIIYQSVNSLKKIPQRINLPLIDFIRQQEAFNDLISEYLESEEPLESDDPLLKLAREWSDFTSVLELIDGNDAFFITYNPRREVINITCCDASNFLQEAFKSFKQIVGFSATLKPFDYYRELMGFPINVHSQEFASPFPKKRRKLLIIPQVSTKFSERLQHYPKVIKAISRITALKPGNYFIFFPSFVYLEAVMEQFPPLAGFSLLKQERGMGARDVQELLDKLKQSHLHHLVFAVQGGMFAEGIDYAGKLAIGAFIVGPPLPLFEWEREEMKRYYEKKYQAGAQYAYIYPGMAKAIQAAGRVIRSETDYGLIVLFDNRFLSQSFYQCMPEDWFMETPQELISNSILRDVQQFWDSINSEEAPDSYEMPPSKIGYSEIE